MKAAVIVNGVRLDHGALDVAVVGPKPAPAPRLAPKWLRRRRRFEAMHWRDTPGGPRYRRTPLARATRWWPEHPFTCFLRQAFKAAFPDARANFVGLGHQYREQARPEVVDRLLAAAGVPRGALCGWCSHPLTVSWAEPPFHHHLPRGSAWCGRCGRPVLTLTSAYCLPAPKVGGHA